MYIKKNQISILIVNLLFLVLFAILFITYKNYEFVIYIGVIVLFLLIILLTNKKVHYPNYILWGLTLWAIMHMSGGGIFINGKKLYEIILIPISDAYNIFKYDQLVHIVGFGVATLLIFHLLGPLLKTKKSWVRLSIIILMGGLGVGALNEILEFIITVIVPQTGVGGYKNTSLDLIADLIGAFIALVVIKVKEK